MGLIELSDGAAAFLLGTVRHLNEAKILPADDAQALQTSAWLEEIEAALLNPSGAVEDWREIAGLCERAVRIDMGLRRHEAERVLEIARHHIGGQ